MLKRLLIAVAAWALVASAASAQSIGQNDLSGNEAWKIGQGAGGPSAYITSDLLRNSSQVVPTTITGAATIGVSTLAKLTDGGYLIITAQPSAATITLPPNPFTGGGLVFVCNPTAAAFATNVVTLAPNTGQTLTGGNITLTTLAANTCVGVIFNRSNTTWYRIQ